MLVRRLVAVLALVTLLAAGVSLGSPGAVAVAGAGSSSTSTRLLDVEVGKSLLGLRLLADEGRATIDPTLGEPEALARLTALSVTSPVAPLSTTVARESRSSRGETSERAPAVTFPTPAAVASGRVDAGTHSATVDESGARASMEAAAREISLAGGLVTAGRLSSTLGSRATGSGSASDRSVEAGPVTVLRLSSLLRGLGIDVADLPLDVVDALVTRLGLAVEGVPSGTSLNGQLSAVTGAVATVESVLADLTGQASSQSLLDPLTPVVTDPVGTVPDAPTVSDPVDAVVPPLTDPVPAPITGGNDPILDPAPELVPDGSSLLTKPIGSVLTSAEVSALKKQLDALLASLELPAISPTTTVADVVALVDTLRKAVPDLLGRALRSLDDAALLAVDGARVVVSTAAVSALDDSGPNVDAGVGAVRIGALDPLPGVTLASGRATVDELAKVVTGAVGRILATVDPGLSGIVKVDLLDVEQGKGVHGGANRAFATVTAVRASVTPPSAERLAALARDLAGRTGVEDLLVAAGVSVPNLGSAMGELGSTLRPALALQSASARGARVRAAATDDSTAALVQGVTVTLGQVTSESIFRPGVTPAIPDASGGAFPEGSSGSGSSTGSGSVSGGSGGAGTGSDVPGAGSSRADTALGEGGSGGMLPVTGGRAAELAAAALLLVALGMGLPVWERGLRCRRAGG